MKRELRYIIFLLLVFICFAIWEYAKPKPVDWSPSYSLNDKIPNGGFVFRQLLGTSFKEQKVLVNSISFTEGLMMFSKAGPFNLLIIDQKFDPDPFDINAMMKSAREGSTVFISAVQLGQTITDTLGVKVYSNPFDSTFLQPNNTQLKLLNPHLRKKGNYNFNHRFIPTYLEKTDSSFYLSLGTDSRNRLNFIAIPLGKGFLFLHLQPEVFTNYRLLYDKPDYTYALLSYLTSKPIIWDEYYKPGKGKSGSPLRYFLHQPALKTGIYFLLTVIFLFLLSHSQRIQRMVPVISPPRNSSMEYATVLGRLYFNQADHAGLASKKIHHFVEHCRKKYHLASGLPDEEWMENLAIKSGFPKQKIIHVFKIEQQVRISGSCTAEQLIQLNEEIEKFYTEENITN